jgi:hypothetical protein
MLAVLLPPGHDIIALPESVLCSFESKKNICNLTFQLKLEDSWGYGSAALADTNLAWVPKGR